MDTVISIAGSSYLSAENCQATHGVDVLQVHGQRDQVMPIEGDTGAPGAEEVLERWAGRNGCGDGGLSGDDSLDLVDDTGDTDASASAWADCDQRAELWRIPSANHYPEFHRGFVERVMDWLAW